MYQNFCQAYNRRFGLTQSRSGKIEMHFFINIYNIVIHIITPHKNKDRIKSGLCVHYPFNSILYKLIECDPLLNGLSGGGSVEIRVDPNIE